MRKYLVLAALFLVVSPAVASEEPPQPVGVHYCATTAWPRDNGKRNTVMDLTITKEGAVKDPAVVQSSGDEHLDAMSLDCVRGWRYRPARRDGAAVDFSWQATVSWGGHPPTEKCARSVEVSKEMLDGISGITRVAFRIMPDGSIKDAEVNRSSGNDDLDRAALDCVSAYRYDTSHVSFERGGFPQDATIDWHDEAAR